MKKKLLLLLLFLPVVFALDCSNLDPLLINSGIMDYHSYGNINFVFESEQTVVEDLNARIRTIPQTNSTITDYTGSFGVDEFGNDVLMYSQDEVTTNSVSWSLESVVYNQKEFLRIEENPVFPYPYDDFPEDVKQYVEFTQVADSSPGITNKVNQLVSGVTDYLTVVSIIANFVSHYLEYNLNYAPSSVPASEVYAQGSGVCDEFSSLMASMLRSVGIPTRFVSGFAYTNIGTGGCSDFGPHSWIEVYVPEHGWISIDPTYKEYSGVDAGHVPLYRSNDASTKIINASILYVDASFTIEAPTFDIEFTDYSLPPDNLEFDATVYPEEPIGDGEYFLLTVNVINPYDEWVLDSLYLTKTLDTQLVHNNNSIPLVLPPNQASNFYFILKTPEDLNPGYIYTYPLLVKIMSGGNKLLNVTVQPDLSVSEDYESLYEMVESDTRQYTSVLGVLNKEITPAKVTTQTPTLTFDIQNLGNVELNDVTVAINYGDKSYSESIGSVFISDVFSYSKTLETPSNTGLINVEVTISSGNASLSFTESYTIITNAPFDFSVSGEEEYTTNQDYELQLGFSSIPSNFLTASIKVLINGDVVKSNPFYFSDNKVLLEKKDFSFGDNTVEVIIEYDDSQGNEYITQDSLNVYSETEYSFIERIGLFFDAIIGLFKLLIGLS